MITVQKCKDIKSLLCDVNNKIVSIASKVRDNERFYLNSKVNKDSWNKLIIYKEILNNKLINCDYTSFSEDQIISQVKRYIYGK